MLRQLLAPEGHRVHGVHPPRGPERFVRLGQDCPVRRWFHPVRPRGRVVTTPFGSEREFFPWLSGVDSTFSGPADWATPIVADKPRARSWRASAEPLHLAAFRAELTHPGQVTYGRIDQLRSRKDLNRYLASHVEAPAFVATKRRLELSPNRAPTRPRRHCPQWSRSAAPRARELGYSATYEPSAERTRAQCCPGPEIRDRPRTIDPRSHRARYPRHRVVLARIRALLDQRNQRRCGRVRFEIHRTRRPQADADCRGLRTSAQTRPPLDNGPRR
jgi:hypothetical protein